MNISINCIDLILSYTTILTNFLLGSWKTFILHLFRTSDWPCKYDKSFTQHNHICGDSIKLINCASLLAENLFSHLQVLPCYACTMSKSIVRFSSPSNGDLYIVSSHTRRAYPSPFYTLQIQQSEPGVIFQ